MTREHGPSTTRRLAFFLAGVVGGSCVLAVTQACANGSRSTQPPATLRIGVGGLPQQVAEAGLSQLAGSFSVEPLAVPNDDGRMRPWLVDGWTTAADALSVTIALRPQARFHDGTPVTATAVAETLRKNLPVQMGPAFDDVSEIATMDPLHVRIDLRRPSQFLVEALETSISKPGAPRVGTGPFLASGPGVPAVLHANPDYFLGRPAIDQIIVTPFPTVRAAWAELLRGNLDMLHEVNLDALDSLEASSGVAVFSFVRHYQYMIAFGSRAAQLQSPQVRRELAAAIDREAIVREALNGHGVASTGPVPPQHWAIRSTPRPAPARQLAANLAGRHLKFTCLVPADSVYERIALAVKRQLAEVSVDMQVVEASQEQVMQAAKENNFDAILGDMVSGPTLFRSYRHWHSRMSFVPPPIPSAKIDAALDKIRYAVSDDAYRAGVAEFEQAVDDDPPALFLAWSERARAVSRKFQVPPPESGQDIFNTIRLWRPVAPPAASGN